MADDIGATIERLLALGIGQLQRDADASEMVAKVYQRMFGEDLCTTCPGKVAAAFQKIINKFNASKNGLSMASEKYRMKNDVVLYIAQPIKGVPQQVSNGNLTDEIAEALLEYEAYAKWIELKQPTKHTPPVANDEKVKEEVKEEGGKKSKTSKK